LMLNFSMTKIAASVAVVIPVYRPEIAGLELFSLQYSLRNLDPGREIFFICPKSLDVSFYRRLAPSAKFATFDDGYFASIASYCRLMLDPQFYERFSAFEFMLILQTDAIIVKDELDYWCAQEYDYIGAPWYPAEPITLKTPDGRNKVIKVSVGNGGLCLRRNKKCIELLNEFPDANKDTVYTEDLLFSIYGFQSKNFSIPSQFVASRFSFECCPGFFYELNANCMPMGSHGWWKYEPEFWLKMLYPDLEPIRNLAIKDFEAWDSWVKENEEKKYREFMDKLLIKQFGKSLNDLLEIAQRGSDCLIGTQKLRAS